MLISRNVSLQTIRLAFTALAEGCVLSLTDLLDMFFHPLAFTAARPGQAPFGARVAAFIAIYTHLFQSDTKASLLWCEFRHPKLALASAITFLYKPNFLTPLNTDHLSISSMKKAEKSQRDTSPYESGF
jgi:hypothetical protein